MGTLSVRIGEEMEQELKEFTKDEKLEQASESARKILVLGLESWRQEKALSLLQQGKVTFLKAAAIAKMDAWNFADLVKEKKTIWIKDKAIKEDIEEAEG